MLTELSLFTGAGIGIVAAEAAGIRTVAMCENDEWCCYALERMWPSVPLFRDVRTLTVDSLPAGIDIISGGFPCQDISSAGKGVGITGERSALWFEMLRLVREVRPRWVLAENVPALRTRGADVVIDGLEAEGYTVWPVVVGAWACGAPHRRDRVWIVGHRSSAPSERDGRGVLGAQEEGGRQGKQDGDLLERPESTSTGAELGHASEERWEECGRSDIPRQEPGARGAGDVADREDDVPHSPLIGCGPRETESRGLTGPWRWPLGPGAEQHEWEEPRVCYPARRTMGGSGQPREAQPDRSTQPPVGRATDGMARSILPSARRALLRACGNAWVPQIPYLIYRWIVRQDALFSGGE